MSPNRSNTVVDQAGVPARSVASKATVSTTSAPAALPRRPRRRGARSAVRPAPTVRHRPGTSGPRWPGRSRRRLRGRALTGGARWRRSCASVLVVAWCGQAVRWTVVAQAGRRRRRARARRPRSDRSTPAPGRPSGAARSRNSVDRAGTWPGRCPGPDASPWPGTSGPRPPAPSGPGRPAVGRARRRRRGGRGPGSSRAWGTRGGRGRRGRTASARPGTGQAHLGEPLDDRAHRLSGAVGHHELVLQEARGP